MFKSRQVLLFLCVVFGLIISPAFPAGVPNSYITPQVLNLGTVTFIQGTDSPGTYKTIYTGATNAGSKCYGLMINWNDQAATHAINIEVTYGGTTLNIATYTTTTGLAGNTFGTPINLFSSVVWPGLPADLSGNAYFPLPIAATLKAAFSTALTAGDQINILALCADL